MIACSPSPEHTMAILFVYGSLKQGFANEHVNAGTRVDGAYRTQERLPMFLLGDGHVPCLVHAPGEGHQVVGELYEVDWQMLAVLDRLERVGEPGGYQRVTIGIERTDQAVPTTITALVYVKSPEDVPKGTFRIGPLVEYTAEHASHFKW